METQFFQNIEKFHSILNSAGDILIVTHFHPDGDAVGSATAFFHFLREKMNRNTGIVFSSPVPETLAFLTPQVFTDAESMPEKAVSAICSADLIICLDCNGFSRTETLCDALRNSRADKVLIDHHLNPSSEEFDIVFSETSVSSTCELLFKILMHFPNVSGKAEKLPETTRRALMTGLTTDTNNFANSVSPGTFDMASSLLAAGVDRDDILEHIYHCHKENRLRLLGHLLSENMRIFPSGVAFMLIDSELMSNFNVSEGDTEGFVNEPLAIKKVKMSILAKEYEGYFRLSVRSKTGVSANMLCREYFHGGGHEQAAGGKLFYTEDIQDKKEIAQYIETVTARFMQNQATPKIK